MQNGHRRREKSCVLAQLGQFFDGGILVRAIGGDGHGLAALHGQTHYGKDLLHVGDFAVLSHSDFALKAFGSFAQDTGGTGVQTFFVLNGDIDALHKKSLLLGIVVVSAPAHSSYRKWS